VSSYEIKFLTREATEYIYDNLEAIDRIEVDAVYEDRKEFLDDMELTDWSLCVEIDGTPAMLFGVAPAPSVGIGVPFMLKTPDLKKCKRDFIRRCPEFVESMQSGYQRLANIVAKENDVAHTWLEWCGFTIEKKHTLNVKGIDMYLFWREADV